MIQLPILRQGVPYKSFDLVTGQHTDEIATALATAAGA